MDAGYIYIIVGIVLLLLILFGVWALFLRKRMGPPTEELKKAEIELAEAKQKEADLYVEDEYGRAQDSLAKATHLVAAKEYKQARKAAEEATDQARKAREAVEQKKAEMKAENERMFGDFNRQVDELKATAAKPERDKPPGAPPEVEGLIGKWEIMKMRIPDLIQRGRIREAHDELKTMEGQINAQKRRDLAAQPGAVK